MKSYLMGAVHTWLTAAERGSGGSGAVCVQFAMCMAVLGRVCFPRSSDACLYNMKQTGFRPVAAKGRLFLCPVESWTAGAELAPPLHSWLLEASHNFGEWAAKRPNSLWVLRRVFTQVKLNKITDTVNAKQISYQCWFSWYLNIYLNLKILFMAPMTYAN